MNQRGFTTEFKVGIFAIVALCFFIVLALRFSHASNEVKGKNYYLIFDFLNGLQQGAGVKYSGGILVGKILSIEPYGDKAKLKIVVSDKIHVDSNTTFSIMSNGLLGEKFVNLSLGSPDDGEAVPLKENSEIFGKEDIGMDKLMSGVTSLAAEMSKVMVPLAQIINKLDKTNDIPKLLASINNLLSNASQMLSSNKGNIQQILANINSIIAKINKGQGTLGKILNDRMMAQSLLDTLDNINVLVSRLSNNPLIGRR